MFDLTGRTGLVTGAGRGIGLALANGLAEHGADVVLVARTESQLFAARQTIEGRTGRRTWAFPFDLGDVEFSRWVLSRTPLGRRGRPEDLVGTAILLASSAGDFITGQMSYVDGGWTALI